MGMLLSLLVADSNPESCLSDECADFLEALNSSIISSNAGVLEPPSGSVAEMICKGILTLKLMG